MLADEPRTRSYQQAIEGNANFFKGKTVMGELCLIQKKANLKGHDKFLASCMLLWHREFIVKSFVKAEQTNKKEHTIALLRFGKISQQQSNFW